MQITPNRAVDYTGGTRSVSRSGPKGKEVTGTADFEAAAAGSIREAGSVTGSRTITGPNGRSATVNFQGTYGPEGRSGSGSITTANGKTINFESQATRDGDSVAVTRTFTGPEGQTRTVENTYSRPRPAEQPVPQPAIEA